MSEKTQLIFLKRLSLEIDRASPFVGPYFSGLMRLALLQPHESAAYSVGAILAPGATLQIAIDGRRTKVQAAENETIHVFDVGPASMHRAHAIIAGAIALREQRAKRESA